MAYVQIPKAIYDKVAEVPDESKDKIPGDVPLETVQARLFSASVQQWAADMSGGGVIIRPELARRLMAILEQDALSPESIVKAVERGMKKSPDGRTIVEYIVDPAYVDDLKNWARAGGHGDNWEQYVSRGFDWVMKQGWLCGVPTEAITLQLSPDDYQMLCDLSGKKPDEFTGTDMVALVRQALEEATPAPFMEPEPAKPGVQA